MKKKYLVLLTLAFLCNEVMAQAAVIGRTYDSQANAYFTLYSSGCRDSRYSSSYPYHWEATSPNGAVLTAQNGQQMIGCYALNQQTSQVLLNANGHEMPLPFSGFAIASNQNPGGGILDFLRAIGDGVNRAATYYNNSAAQTQRNTTNLTPGMTGGNTMNCTPDGRGGYNCR
ncbi:hypothetical protein ICN19_01985 [Polynucleobacter sp. AP-Capit-er-40B-B4]|uniref:hypothetical protein n=1 Tax=Polynucleobacter sp. AP-Capit-er-40B-B4 TaxID=2576927 RepID=UPI001C0B81D1|nr:hypothetical protein [Polynucleobacter sp. AP-Capit-er-40B-B4]MBU3580782.1 hypothetical protein [Polynucleobacter sp. AP-Capit-er-40B-B4]